VSEGKKGDPLATNITEDVIQQALKSVERHSGKPGAEEKAEAPDAAEVATLKEELLSARQALRQKEAELETSQEMARETLDKLKDQHERMLRAAADLENYKKRAAKEREEVAKFGQEKLLREVLPVLDNLDRALEHALTPSDFDGLKSGLLMTRKLFEDTLGKFGVKGFSARGEPFDPNRHEAMQAVESDEAPGTVVAEHVRGFMLHDRLMRPAMVVVARPRAAAVAATTAAEPAPTSVPTSEVVTDEAATPRASASAAAVPDEDTGPSSETP